ncbi:MAG: aminotransferase class V-fold PLP-dependent enzyme [Gemmatimonadota bacterium]
MQSRRNEFSIPAGVRYLNCAYMAPIPRVVEEAGLGGVRRKGDPSRIEARHFFEESDLARRLFAELIDADPEGVAIVPGVSYGVEIVARNLSPRPGQRIVVLAEQFPANVYPWKAVAERTGAYLYTVERPVPGESWSAAVIDAVDSDTALVTLGQVHWTDGSLLDLEAIGARAREVGAAFVIDGTQSIGALPFSVGRLKPDAVVCACYKWLLGPYSVGLAWIGERFRGGEPVEYTWLGRPGSEDFRALVDYRDELRPDASRFDSAERANFALMPMTVAGLEYVLALGPEAVQAHGRTITDHVVEGVLALDMAPPEGPRSGHIVGLSLPAGVDGGGLHRALTERGIYVSRRGAALRISPHVYNDLADADALVGALRTELTPEAS